MISTRALRRAACLLGGVALCSCSEPPATKVAWFADRDGDTYGDAGTVLLAATAPDGYVAVAFDCDDYDATSHPFAREVCDGVDNDCSGVIDDGVMEGVASYADADGDTYGDPETLIWMCSVKAGRVTNPNDCDDMNAAVHQGAPEECNGRDDDCDGHLDDNPIDGATYFPDVDGDGYGVVAPGTLACAAPDGLAANHDDCDDARASVHPGAAEACNARDDDCDGIVDEPGTCAHAVAAVPARATLLFYYDHQIQAAANDRELWLPYLAYVDEAGTVLDPYFWDTFLLLDINLNAGVTRKIFEHFLDTTFAAAPGDLFAEPLPNSDPSAWAARLAGAGETISQGPVSLMAGMPYTFQVAMRAETPVDGREGVLCAVFTDSEGTAIVTGAAPGLTWSSDLGCWYSYLAGTTTWRQRTVSFSPPVGAASLEVRLRRYNAASGAVFLDNAQLVPGNALLSTHELAAANYDTALANGGFERSGSWSGLVSEPSGVAYAGFASGSKNGWYQGPVAVTAGQTYTIAFDAKATVASDGGAEGVVCLRLRRSDGSVLTSDGPSSFAYSSYLDCFYQYLQTTDQWGAVSIVFTVPPASPAASLEVGIHDWQGQGLWFDNVQLVAGPTKLDASALVAAHGDTLVQDGLILATPSTTWKHRSARPMPEGDGVLPALDREAGALADRRQRNVFIALPTAIPTMQGAFGDIDGVTKTYNTHEERVDIWRWMVDATVERWFALAPKNLALRGFYWLDETSPDSAAAQAVSQRVHAWGLELVSSPYRRFAGTSCASSSYADDTAAAFDVIWQQPNVWPPGHSSVTAERYDRTFGCFCQAISKEEYLSSVGVPTCELARAELIARRLEAEARSAGGHTLGAINIEWVEGLEDSAGHGRVQDYLNLDGALGHDFTAFPTHLYYEAAGYGWRCARSGDAVYRRQYDAVYDFVKRVRERHGFP